VPQPAAHLNDKWFHKVISRSEAENMLRRVTEDGAFLVRESTSDKNGLSISFRAEGKIKHCRVRKEGRMYCIGDTEFDSMVAMIHYYEKHALYRKMKLRFAVDQELLASMAAPVVEEDDSIYCSQSLYQTPNSIAARAGAKSAASRVTANTTYNPTSRPGVTVRSKFAYRAAQKDELSFPIDAIITDVEKKDGGWWSGRYGDMTGWLPINYVEDVQVEEQMQETVDESGDNILGQSGKHSIGVTPELRIEPRPSHRDMRLIFRIVGSIQPNGEKNWGEVGTDDENDVTKWSEAIQVAIQKQLERQEQNVEREKEFKISIDLSDLIFYCESVRWKDWDLSAANGFQLMSSWNEKKAVAACSEKSKEAAKFVGYNTRNYSRVYPRGTRVDSSNFDPQPHWNCGMQLVALNYQTPDKPMWVNRGKFRLNGGCGYVTKPALLRDPKFGFDPYNYMTWKAHVTPLVVEVTVLSARHLIKPGRGVASPYVEVDIVGVNNDSSLRRRTRVESDNGFKPKWNETFKFEVSMPELACLCFTVNDEDMFGEANAIGQAVLPLWSPTKQRMALRSGWRSIQLRSVYGDPMNLSALLVKCTFTHGDSSSQEYGTTQMLRAEYRRKKERQDMLAQNKARAHLKGQSMSEINAELDRIAPEVLALGNQLMSRESVSKVDRGGGAARM